MFSLTLRATTEAELPIAARSTCGRRAWQAKAAPALPGHSFLPGPSTSSNGCAGTAQDCGGRGIQIVRSFENPEEHP